MSGISDPGKAGRGDRRRAQRLIDAAYAAGRLTSADRALRTDRVRSAHTKGDLAILVRDLTRGSEGAGAAAAATVDPSSPQARSLGSAIPPDQLSAMMKGGSARTIDLAKSMRSAMTADGVRTARRVFLIILVVVVIGCGLGVAAIVGLVVSGVNDAMDSGSETSVNLHTADGWTELVAAIEEETGSSRVYDAAVYREYASVNVPVDEGAMRYVYRNGTFQLLNSPVTPVGGELVDLADIDPELIDGLAEETAERHDMPEFESAYVIVRALTGDPTVSVYVQQTGRLSKWTAYNLDGEVVGGDSPK